MNIYAHLNDVENRDVYVKYTVLFQMEELSGNENLLRDYYSNKFYLNENSIHESFKAEFPS